MSEFVNPCPGGGVLADREECVGCGIPIPLAGGRYVDHSRPYAIEPTGMNVCDCGCGALLEPGHIFPTPVGWFVEGHEPTPAEMDAELRAAGAADAAADRYDTDTLDAA